MKKTFVIIFLARTIDFMSDCGENVRRATPCARTKTEIVTQFVVDRLIMSVMLQLIVKILFKFISDITLTKPKIGNL